MTPGHEAARVAPLVLRLVEAAAATIREHAELLTELDRAIGDADHGANMRRGFDAIAAARELLAARPLGPALQQMGQLLVMSVGGAAGPLYGSLLLAMGRAAPAEAGGVPLDAMLAEGIAAVKQRGRSDRGQKTMLDVLVPVQETWHACATQGLPREAALERIRRAARDGLEATRAMVATKGRASYLRERSAGHLDPGACSSCLLVNAVCDVLERSP